ncbi:hypothetical protein R3P38DRAFT_3626099 [Favolaschia claudopus]|uniref:Uncharacterized protein n=1 Tax=Favolaschia claudopus TaxID=2862362 RepID=A0AAW0A0C8_9AGAR
MHQKVFSMPYGFGSEEWQNVRARNFISSLEECASVHTIQLTASFTKFHDFLRLLPDISSLETVEFTDSALRSAVNHIPELKALARFKPNLLFQPTPSTTKNSIPTRATDPSFIPMLSASEETRESIWTRILFFAMSIDDELRISTPRMYETRRTHTPEIQHTTFTCGTCAESAANTALLLILEQTIYNTSNGEPNIDPTFLSRTTTSVAPTSATNAARSAMPFQHTAEVSTKGITEVRSSIFAPRVSASYPPKSAPTRDKVEDNAPDASATCRVNCTALERRDLDTGSGDRIVAEGTTAEQRAVEFVQLIRNKKCFSVDKNGAKCTGISVLRAQNQTFNRHNHFVGCSGWTKDFPNHRSSVLPPDLDEHLFITAIHAAECHLAGMSESISEVTGSAASVLAHVPQRLALPHLYHSLHLTSKNAPRVATQLEQHKDTLGPCIHFIRSFHADTASLLAILSHATNLQFLVVSEWGREFQRGMESLSLPALHTVILPPYLRDLTPFLSFLENETHGGTLRRLLLPEDLDKMTPTPPPILDLCPNLVQLEFRGEYDPSQITGVKNEHRALRRISAMCMPPKLTNLDIDVRKFPALKEIHLRHLEWPTTERELAKSGCVAIAESLAEKGVAVIGLSGRAWVTRVKRGRRCGVAGGTPCLAL